MKQKLLDILKSEEQLVKIGSDGDYEQYMGITNDCYNELIEKLEQFIQSIKDPDNQPNQYGIKL